MKAISKNKAREIEIRDRVMTDEDVAKMADIVQNFEDNGTQVGVSYNEITNTFIKPTIKCIEDTDKLERMDEVYNRLLEFAITNTYYGLLSISKKTKDEIIPLPIIIQFLEHSPDNVSFISEFFTDILCFVVLDIKMKGHTDASFEAEYLSYTLHKRKVLNKIVNQCRELVPYNFKEDETGPFAEWIGIISIYTYHLYQRAKERYLDYIALFDRMAPRLQANLAREAEKLAREAEEELLRDEDENNAKKKNAKTAKNAKKQGTNAKKASKSLKTTDTSRTQKQQQQQPDTYLSASAAADKDETPFMEVRHADDQRTRYYLTNLDYYKIRTNTDFIIAPLKHMVSSIVSTLRYSRTGFYLNISNNDQQIAHISFFHYGEDQYHFKINRGHNAAFDIPHTDEELTIPFNLHRNKSNVITCSLQPMIHPSKNINRNTQFYEIVRHVLNQMTEVLNGINVNAGMTTRIKRRRHRKQRTKKLRFRALK